MKAIIQEKYGEPEDVLRFEDTDIPTPEADQVLVKVQAAGIHSGDVFLMRGLPYVIRLGFGLTGPRNKTPGLDFAGRVEAVGSNVTGLALGEEVFGEATGSLAEYAVVDASKVFAKPANLTFEEAAALTVSGLTALHAVRDKAGVQAGDKVLINGASGGVGTFAVQIAKWLEAEVTGVCSSSNVDLVKSLGADHVIDYRTEDFAETEVRYDFLLDNVGNHSLSDLRKLLTPNGTLIPNNGSAGGRVFGTIGRTIGALLTSPFVSQKLSPFVSTARPESLRTLKELVEAGKVRPVIDRTYSLDDAAAAAAYVGTGHVRGKVVVTV